MKPFPRLDILPPAQRQLWPTLAVVRTEGLVLYGGTAITLLLGHRESIDFDFFTHAVFQPEALFEQFPFLAGAEVLQSRPNTLTVLVRSGTNGADPVKISFFGRLRFGRLAKARRAGSVSGFRTPGMPEGADLFRGRCAQGPPLPSKGKARSSLESGPIHSATSDQGSNVGQRVALALRFRRSKLNDERCPETRSRDS